jgi:peptide/nickel transport system substrate-binding protein
LKKNADDATPPYTRYVSIAPSVIPNLHCRLAIFYAFDKAGALRAYGGPTAGAIAKSMTAPGIPGYDASYDPYPSGSAGTGDDTKAKQELQQCGKPNGFSTKFSYATPSTQAPNLFRAEQAALGKVGIKITAATQDHSSYYSTFIGSPANIKNQGLGIANAAWGPDFPTGTGYWNSIANGANILPTGNSNYPSLSDPIVNKILTQAPKGKTTDADWKTLDERVMKKAVYLPYIYGYTLYYRSPRMTNVTCDNAIGFGEYDFVNVGVTK